MRTYCAKCDVFHDVVCRVTTTHIAWNHCVPESVGSRRKAVSNVRINAFIITYVTASSSNQRPFISASVQYIGYHHTHYHHHHYTCIFSF